MCPLMAAGGIGQSISGETMNRSLSILALFAIPLLAGCSYERADTPPTRDTSDVNTNTTTTDRRHTRDDHIREIRDAREDSADSSRVALAYPTGNRSTSAVLAERMSPPEVRLGEPDECQHK